MDKALYYNAVAVVCDGDRGKILRLQKQYGNWERAWQNLSSEALPMPGTLPDPREEWEKLSKANVRLIMKGGEEYPKLLEEIPDPPFGIYIRGTLPVLPNAAGAGGGTGGAIAVVGTRRATPDGKTTTRYFTRKLAGAGMPIVSGLAFGIDAAAHEGCLEAKGATTIAVLAGGLADVYPRNHARLAEKILAARGAMISEYPLHAPPYPLRFLERNRLISGLARGTLIVEAPLGSGSLVTARHAAEANRDVFVVPGPVTHANFKGSHALIRQGAELVASPDDILAAYGIAPAERLALEEKNATAEEKLILKALHDARGAADVDKIIIMTKLEPRVVNRSLSFLLLRGAVVEKSGGYTIETTWNS
ncbi:MAG TPA: DNA-processing protein DprA [Candidatus Paceibacterota bacterium]|jgi:DNA processing protein|nr:DNA-processing protein DprA [Candidatus Paceibacterota bacterium]